MGTQLSSPKGAQPTIFGPYLLWPNGWMDQDATYYEGNPRPNRHSVRWGPRSPSPKRGRASPIFGPCLLWPNCWMDQHATWHERSPWTRPHCVRWGPSSPPLGKGHSIPLLFGHVYLWPNGRPSQQPRLSSCTFLRYGIDNICRQRLLCAGVGSTHRNKCR